MKRRSNLNSIIKSVTIASIYFLFDRSLNLNVITSNPSVSSVYTLISEGAFVLVCLYYMSSIIRSNNIRYYYLDVILVFIAFAGTLFISTYINNGNIRRWFSAVYPVIGSLLFMSICCKNINRAKRFINAVSNLYFLLLSINLLLMAFEPDLFGATHYFVGIKNQIAISLTFGFLFIYFDSHLNGNKTKFYLYVFIHIATSLLAFSGGGLICMAVIYLCFFVRPIGKFLESLSLTYVGAVFSVVLIFIASGSISILLNFPVVKYVIVNILGKNLTLTNRVFIWDKLIRMLSGHYILGRGVADTVNLFSMNKTFTNRISFVGSYSAHNQFLQTLYEGGIVSLAIMLTASVVASRKLREVSDASVCRVAKIAIIAIFIVFFDEAAGYISYFQIVQIACLMVGVVNRNNTASDQLRIMHKIKYITKSE